MDATKTHRQSWQGCQPESRAANHQSTTDMENYENTSLNKPVTIMMNQHTWKRTAESDIVWQN